MLLRAERTGVEVEALLGKGYLDFPCGKHLRKPLSDIVGSNLDKEDL